ncbi:HET-domain-containing protein [Camillea tinctor]|nr:HET-domain-containing protein [Camillea tinctor]
MNASLGLEQIPKIDPSQPSELLCDRCIGWDDIDLHRLGSDPIHNVITAAGLSLNRHCLLCRAVLEVLDTRRQALGLSQPWSNSQISVDILGPLYLETGYSPRRRTDLHANIISIKMFVRLIVKVPEDRTGFDEKDDYRAAPEPLGPKTKERTLFTATPQFCVYYSPAEAPRLYKIEEWTVPFFDVLTIKRWIHGCDTIHAEKCAETLGQTDLPQGFRLIDVVSMNIIELPEPVRFVALSYMWGSSSTGDGRGEFQLEKNNFRDLETPGKLSEITLPGVISDAISLCRDLGETYLWIDRLCIIQDHPELKPAQILAMDRIYRSATFTIVAALNVRNGEGLPGYRQVPRNPRSSVWRPPYHAEVETRTIEPNGIESLVDTSLWNHRGWTFQERLLSRRCLFITEHQVVFECCQAQASEELTWCPPMLLEQRTLAGVQGTEEMSIYNITGYFESASLNGGAWSPDVKDKMPLKKYSAWVKNYTSRQLSYNTDILNAFSGVASALSESFACPMLFGLPERYLPQCLMWSCPGEVGRRDDMPEIPSWSWAASLGCINYEWADCGSGTDSDMLEIASLVLFYYQDPACGLRKLNAQERWVEHEVTLEELASRDKLPPLNRKALPGDWRTAQDWGECPHNPRQAILHQTLNGEACKLAAAMYPGSLVFNTTVASLSLDYTHQPGYSGKDTNMQQLSICNKEGIVVGHLEMSRSWVKVYGDVLGTRGKPFDFVVISGALKTLAARKWSVFLKQHHDVWQLRVMLVDRLACQPFVARRVGVGVITMCYWKQCQPRWETVVLC